MATETVEIYQDGTLVESVNVSVPSDVANERTLRDQARAALQANRTFLALPTPTTAQNAAQIKALTRQANALIRMAVQDMSGTD